MNQSATMVRLSIMMFLQFFVWGAWYVSMTGFINDNGMAAVTGAAYTVGPLAAILAPFFLGMVADRFFASERVLGVLHILGGAFLIAAPFAAKAFVLEEAPPNASLFYQLVLHDLPAYVHPFALLLLLHMLCYMPTLGLTTSLSFHNLQNQEKQFPVVRVLGTIGWIVGNIAVSYLPGKDQSASQFYMAGGAGILLGLYSFTLPHTPPPLRGKKTSLGQILGTDSLRLFRSPSYAVFIVCSFLICIPLAGYYNQARNYVESCRAYEVSLTSETVSRVEKTGERLVVTEGEQATTYVRDAQNDSSINDKKYIAYNSLATSQVILWPNDDSGHVHIASVSEDNVLLPFPSRTEIRIVGPLINGSATFTMSLGQMSEVFFMLIMPLMFIRLGVKWMLLIGMGAWVLRYALFSIAADDKIAWMIILGVLLHGICYDFFFVTGMIYADKKAPPEIRNQAQGFLVLITQGLGLGLGAKLFNAHVIMNTKNSEADWQIIWWYPAVFACAVMIVFFLLFWDRVKASPTPASEAPHPELYPKTTPESA